ncbi:MAG: hypothetical protein AAF456_04630 [Planctomycetota bacterium]
MIYAILGLLFVVLIVFAVLTAKTWHWVNIVFLILTFIAGVVATGALAECLDKRRRAMEGALSAEAAAERNKRDADVAVYGSDNAVEYDSNCLRGIDQELTREMMGRGRVWSRGTVTIAPTDNRNREFTFPAARDNTVNMGGMVVYAFVDGPIDVAIDGAVEQQVYPVEFIGTFRVINEAADKLSLEPIFIANSSPYGDPQGTWSLMEKMPLDRRDAFKKVEGMMGDDFDLAAYRDVLVNKYLQASVIGMDPASAEYEALIDRYAFDGQRLGDIATFIDSQNGRINTTFEPKPEEVFYVYRFDKAVKEADGFQVDYGGSGRIDQDGTFSPLGQAVDPALHLGQKVAFAEGDEVLIDQKTALGYQRTDGTPLPEFDQRYPVTEVDRIFIRELNDYPFILATLRHRQQVLKSEQDRLAADNKTTSGAFTNAQEQLTVRDDRIRMLIADGDNLRRDRDQIEVLAGDRQRELDQVLAEIQRLEGEIDASYRAIRGQ